MTLSSFGTIGDECVMPIFASCDKSMVFPINYNVDYVILIIVKILIL